MPSGFPLFFIGRIPAGSNLLQDTLVAKSLDSDLSVLMFSLADPWDPVGSSKALFSPSFAYYTAPGCREVEEQRSSVLPPSGPIPNREILIELEVTCPSTVFINNSNNQPYRVRIIFKVFPQSLPKVFVTHFPRKQAES